MFPLTHALAAQTMLHTSHPRVILGAIFPDLGNAIGLNRDITHEMGSDFYPFCRATDESFVDFARAVITHGSNPAGLDYYADQSFEGQDTGYCFQRAVPLVDKVIEACGIPYQMGLWKAHNFIEMAYDVIAAEMHPHLTGLVMNALEDVTAVNSCSHLLGRYFHLNSSIIEAAFNRMPHFFCLDQVTPLHLAEKYAIQLEKRHNIRSANPAVMAQVIQEARERVEDEFSIFISGSMDMISRLLTEYPGNRND